MEENEGSMKTKGPRDSRTPSGEQIASGGVLAEPSDNDIQRAHDVLHFLLMPGSPDLFMHDDGDKSIALNAAHDALAWILGYPCGDCFQTNLNTIRDALRRRGLTEIDVGKPISHEEAKARGLV